MLKKGGFIALQGFFFPFRITLHSKKHWVKQQQVCLTAVLLYTHRSPFSPKQLLSDFARYKRFLMEIPLTIVNLD